MDEHGALLAAERLQAEERVSGGGGISPCFALLPSCTKPGGILKQLLSRQKNKATQRIQPTNQPTTILTHNAHKNRTFDNKHKKHST